MFNINSTFCHFGLQLPPRLTSIIYNYFSQESVSDLKWDPTGHLLLSMARADMVKIWGRVGSTWLTVHSLFHTAHVNAAAWCPLPGTGSDPRLMLAV